MIIFENESIRISLDKETPCIELTVKTELTSEQYKEAFIKYLDVYISTKNDSPKFGFFIDASKLGNIPVATIEWASYQITPKFIEAGLTHQVFVNPEDVLGQLFVEDYMYKTKDKLTQMCFNTKKEAKNWLKGCLNIPETSDLSFKTNANVSINNN